MYCQKCSINSSLSTIKILKRSVDDYQHVLRIHYFEENECYNFYYRSIFSLFSLSGALTIVNGDVRLLEFIF
jgi:hypothetical protein